MQTSVAICLLTCNRPDGLRHALLGIDALEFSDSAPDCRVVVVDNSADAGAREFCERHAPNARHPIEYVWQRTPGISAARNAALHHANGADWIAFLDDDEIPRPDWLDVLLRTQAKAGADVVGGAVVPELPAKAPAWVRRGRFLEYTRHATGTILPYAFTNNVLFRSRIVDELQIEFEQRYGLTGGEDRHFFQRVGLAGYRIVWCDEAVVEETVPTERARLGWILQRNYRYGNTQSCVQLDLRPGIRTRVRLLALAAYRILKGGVLLPLTWPGGFHYVVANLNHLAYAAGVLSGWCGHRYREYRRR